MDRTETPAFRRKPPDNGHSPTLSPPRHISTLPDIVPVKTRTAPVIDRLAPVSDPPPARPSAPEAPKGTP